ncbi:HAAS domain-containing protein [Robertmurraya massiliosenegalensis]|uniref:HAAS domain-containing protein n=1 Tax=Robertmurraya massiliosenegalensis TaxID=1287657 RepID=UPI0002F6C748|nr:hypothetical protein [Robertmurraya massiliosenegalensis]
MLSAKSEKFIDNLRMYLMMSGKKEQEIEELIEELENHLFEVEKSGKGIEDIIDQTPEQYMASLKKEMKTDYRQIIKFLPILFLSVIAYVQMGPAIRGEFELNIIQIVGLPITTLLGFGIYVYFLQQAGKKQYSNKKFFIGGMISSSIVTLIAIVLMVGSKLIMEPFFKGNTFADVVVIVICSCIFIITAFWSKSWVTIWIPAILFIPDVIDRLTDLEIEMWLTITIGSYLLMFIVLLLNVWIAERKKR